MFKIIIKKPIEFVKNNFEIIFTAATATATIAEVSASLYFYNKNNWQNNLKNATNKKSINSLNDIERKEYVENN